MFDDQQAVMPIQSNTTGILTTPSLSTDAIFYVRYTKGIGTSDLARVNVKVVDKTAVYVPDAFTPNRDGKNDVLNAVAFGLVKLHHFTI